MNHPRRSAFTLVEVMVSTAIIGLLMIILVGMTNQISQTWRNTAEKIEKFSEARDGFEAMTRNLAQATLNTNWDYLGTDSVAGTAAAPIPRPKHLNDSGFKSFVPMMYGRTADLRFISGPMSKVAGASGLNPITFDGTGNGSTVWPTHGVFFQAPLGTVTTTSFGVMNNLLNTWGYYVQAGWDPTTPGFLTSMVNTQGHYIVKPRWRSRLMEFRQPAENMALYDPAGDNFPHWFTFPLKNSSPPVRSISENVVALVILPRLSKDDEDNLKLQALPWMLCPYYIYDSTQTLNAPSSYYGAGADTSSVNPKNQLPPVVEVTMVALDERSAKKLDEKYGTGPNPNGTASGSYYMGLDQAGQRCVPPVDFTTLFTDQTTTPMEGPLGNPTYLASQGLPNSDLNNLQQILIHEGLTYRVFTTNVTIRGAKWSRVQTK